jgi:UDP-2,4-diacetamido-2,4,6-trideoxy-beta-L-altropyranose hydrolase
LKAQKNHKRILFRADGNSHIGLGHIYRCIAICDRLSNEFECYFAIRNPTIEIYKLIKNYAKIIKLDLYNSYTDEALDLKNNIIPFYNFSIITLDGYFFDTYYQKILKKDNLFKIISIDDDQPFHYVSDVVINHANGVLDEDISREPLTRLYLGSNYLMLRKEFLELEKQTKLIDGISSILVCFGGADPEDYTNKIINCIKNHESIKDINVIIGATYLHKKKLYDLIQKSQKLKIHENLNASEMAKLMFKTNLAIVSSGTISLEAFMSKMILLTGITADNQLKIYNGLIKEPTVYGVSSFKNLNCDTLMNKIKQIKMVYTNYTFSAKFQNSDQLVNIYKDCND